jgi:nucleoside-diphosphate-sugar epimerase
MTGTNRCPFLFTFAKNLKTMIVVTGAAGFIGSCMAAKLNEMGHDDLILVDDFTKEAKRRNWEGKRYMDKIQRDDFFAWAEKTSAKWIVLSILALVRIPRNLITACSKR